LISSSPYIKRAMLMPLISIARIQGLKKAGFN
jgi:hypothetical protein